MSYIVIKINCLTPVKVDVFYEIITYKFLKLKIEVLNKIHCYNSLTKLRKCKLKSLRTLKSKSLHNNKLQINSIPMNIAFYPLSFLKRQNILCEVK